MPIIVIERVKGVNVLRDDLLPGGTKSILMPSLIGTENEYAYASPVYGGFQIALSAYCKRVGKQATIFCAKRNNRHPNTAECISLGAKVVEVPHGYLSNVEKKCLDYCKETGAVKLKFGAMTDSNINLISARAREVIKKLGSEPEEIFCAIGSGTLVSGILRGTEKAKITGVQVGQKTNIEHPRLTVLEYHKSFDKPSRERMIFKSTPNYDLKAWEYCLKYKTAENVLFWNVL